MKRIFLLLMMLVGVYTTAMAQGQQTASPQLVLSSESSKLDAMLQRNKLTLAQQSYSKVDNMMTDRISELQASLASATPAQQSVINSKINTLQALKGDINTLSSNLTANRTTIKDKLDQFVQLY